MVSKLQYLVNHVNAGDKISWELEQNNVAVYAVQGHRDHMEDRFIVNSDINRTGVSVFAVFDGHGGEFAADYARDKLIPNINSKVIELKNIISGKETVPVVKIDEPQENDEKSEKKEDQWSMRRKSFKKTVSASHTDDCMENKTITDPELLGKLESLPRAITREVKPGLRSAKKLQPVDITSYLEIDTNNNNSSNSSSSDGKKKINYQKLLTDEVLAADYLLIDAAKKRLDVAGSTALIVVLDDNKLIVANVGDSRGVMCDSKGNAIPLSFDHKPQQQRERQRINKAGGLVTFNGVWRVAGILATSRALGDYPLKDKKYVIADPDILTFDLDDHDPMFLILASDGLWDTFSNEEAVAFIKQRLDEPFYGAKSITLQSYYRGSLDNITVIIINFKDRKSSIYEQKKSI
ncbi:protein phosphatase 1L isoform X2 [Cotesia glomerata]|uniref:protein phosphatase 1L isoform X2 n=1 Tax=Cotesia glomerata TaxID=32391 RepID=UPI001D02ED0C|nr:protein phosphatase 1L isoform X2 [Cotesia glomerata]